MKTIKEKKQLIVDYMSKCPFIEFHNIVQLNEETATIDVAFDHDFEEVKDADRSKDWGLCIHYHQWFCLLYRWLNRRTNNEKMENTLQGGRRCQ